MKNNDNEKLLARQRQIDEERKAQAILRNEARRRVSAAAMRRVAEAGRAS